MRLNNINVWIRTRIIDIRNHEWLSITDLDIHKLSKYTVHFVFSNFINLYLPSAPKLRVIMIRIQIIFIFAMNSDNSSNEK